jgi:hypothetical protein
MRGLIYRTGRRWIRERQGATLRAHFLMEYALALARKLVIESNEWGGTRYQGRH